MRAIRLKAVVDERATLSASLPPGVPAGTVDVLVFLERDEASPGAGVDDDSFDELMRFHLDHRLDGVTLRELVEEGRR